MVTIQSARESKGPDQISYKNQVRFPIFQIFTSYEKLKSSALNSYKTFMF